eukprot:Opistho-2@89578
MNLAYVGLSSALTALVVAHTYVQKEQFYPTVVQITRSSGSMMVRPQAVSCSASHLLSYESPAYEVRISTSAFAYACASLRHLTPPTTHTATATATDLASPLAAGHVQHGPCTLR